MNILDLPRGGGKTTSLVLASSITNIPIVVANKQFGKYCEGLAREKGLRIPEPITIYELDTMYSPPRNVLIDELDGCLHVMFPRTTILASTITSDKWEKSL